MRLCSITGAFFPVDWIDCCSKVDIVLEGGLPVLIEMMHSADVETAHQGTGVVANLAEVVENQGKMVESGKNFTNTPTWYASRLFEFANLRIVPRNRRK